VNGKRARGVGNLIKGFNTMNVEKFLPEEFKQDEKDYWQARVKLLSKYEGKWIAFHNKEVIASGDNIYDVTLAALQKSSSCAYITKVGEEDKLMVKVRRREFSYNLNYQPFPLPQAKVRFYNARMTQNKNCDDVIPDTGADTTALPVEDCHEIRLFETPGMRLQSRSYGGEAVPSIVIPGFAEIDDQKYLCYIEPVVEVERLLGRDVLNQLTVTFQGLESKVIFE